MTTDKESYFRAFTLHCSEDRPSIQKPFKKDGYYFATDGRSLLYLPQSEMPELDFFIEREDTPNCLAVIPSKRSDLIQIDSNKLKSTIENKAPKIREQQECLDCGGEGGEECNLGHWHACEYCDGRGTYEKTDGKLIPNESSVFVFNGGVAIKVYMLQKLITTSRLLGYDKIMWVYRENERVSLFQIGPFGLLIMTCANPKVDDNDEYTNVDISEITNGS